MFLGPAIKEVSLIRFVYLQIKAVSWKHEFSVRILAYVQMQSPVGVYHWWCEFTELILSQQY